MDTSYRAVATRYGGYWGEHPSYPAKDWAYEVANNDTRQGYWEWVANKIKDEGGSHAARIH